MTMIPKVIKGKAWCGLYDDGELGWHMPKFLSPGSSTLLTADQLEDIRRDTFYRSDFYRVEITVRPICDKRGRPIIRKARSPMPKYRLSG